MEINELSTELLKRYMSKAAEDSQKHSMDPSKRSAKKRDKTVKGFSKAFEKTYLGGSIKESHMSNLDIDAREAAEKHFGMDLEETEVHHVSPDGREAMVHHVPSGKSAHLVKTKNGNWIPNLVFHRIPGGSAQYNNEEVESLIELSTNTLKAALRTAIKKGLTAKTEKDKNDAVHKMKKFAGGLSMKSGEK